MLIVVFRSGCVVSCAGLVFVSLACCLCVDCCSLLVVVCVLFGVWCWIARCCLLVSLFNGDDD